jgi:5'-3' exonuclease
MRLVVDAWNAFSGGYIGSEKVSETGEPVGGLIAILESISRVSQKIKPVSIDVIWKKNILKKYKNENGTTIFVHPSKKANRPYGEEESDACENLKWQIKQSVNLLSFMGCGNAYHPELDSFDLISFLIKEVYKKDVVILSNNKNFYNLLNKEKRICIFNTKGKEMNSDYVVEKYGVPLDNFLIAKSIVGDPSDGTEGVRGVGWKKIPLIEPLMSNGCTLEDVFYWSSYKAGSFGTKVPAWLSNMNEQKTRKKIKENFFSSLPKEIQKENKKEIISSISITRDEKINQNNWKKILKLEGLDNSFWWKSIAACKGRESDEQRIAALKLEM